MASKNVKVNETNYNGVQKVELPLSEDTSLKATFVETSDATASAGDIAVGKSAYVNGVKVDGTNSGGGSATLIEKTITENGTYNPSDDGADGFSKVTVNVSGGGLEVLTGTLTIPEDTAVSPTITHNANSFNYLFVIEATEESKTIIKAISDVNRELLDGLGVFGETFATLGYKTIGACWRNGAGAQVTPINCTNNACTFSLISGRWLAGTSYTWKLYKFD